MAEAMNYQSCCRLCLSERMDSLQSIFGETPNDPDLTKKILQHLNIEITSSDKMSTMVCEECIEKVSSWNSYKEQCVQNQKKFEDVLEPQQKPATPPPSFAPEPISESAPFAHLNVHIKEEPITELDNPDETPPEFVEPEPEREDPLPPENVLDQSDMAQIYVKSEPLDIDQLDQLDQVDESMEHEYNEFPPTLSPQQMNNGDMPEVIREEAEFHRKCSVCGKVFSSAGNKKKHERVQHGLHPVLSVTPKENGLTNGELQASDVVKESQRKILYGMGLKLVKSSAETVTNSSLSKIELSYIEKCKAMVSMHKTLVCACHNVPHQNLKGLLSHLRALRIWFPVFTCYNCMITFTDRSTFTRHISRCSSQALNSITKLSNLTQRTEVKTRLYQNFKCTICKFMFSFHEDFCTHVDLDHSMLQFPIHCPCGRVFEDIDDYKDHVYVSCLVEYYCDICFITTKTLSDFQKHATEVHDESEGFILLQDDNYKVRKPAMHSSPGTSGVDESFILTGKRERKTSVKNPFMDDDGLDELVPSAVVKPTFYTPKTNNRVCPVCHKEYSSYKNMMRHYKTHKNEDQLQHEPPQEGDMDEEEAFYSCPDCGGMFNTLEWKIHLTEKHQNKPCGECGKFFQFQTELDHHRSVHLNIKVYRDSKTQSYKSTMVSPSSDGEVMLLCEICDVMFPTKEDLKNHKLTHDETLGMGMDMDMDLEGDGGSNDVDVVTPDVRKYKCELCTEEFNSYSGLWEHNRVKHPERKTPNANTYPKECKECGKVCTTGAAYYRHRQIHDKPAPGDATESKGSLLRVRKVEPAEEESYHTCKRCFKVFSNKYNLKNHLKCHGININPASKRVLRKVVCKICQQVFENNDDLIQHKQEYHTQEEIDECEEKMSAGPMMFTCDVCVMTFSSKIALKKHKEKHNQETKKGAQPIFCKYCKVPFESTAQLSQHMLLEHDERLRKRPIKEVQPELQHTCNICQKSFQTNGALTTHVGWHKRAQNEGNTKVMKNSVPLPPKVVVKEEPMDPRYQCATCLAELPNDTALQVHILEKHRSVSAIMLIPRCNTCNKDFATQDEYETHKRLHDFLERQKLHEQKMLQQQDIKPVVQTPPGPKPKSYPCKHCNAAFSRSDTLGAHMRQFHKEHIVTEFRCHHCDRVFEKQNSLTIHLKVHEKQRIAQAPVSKPLFSCSICNMGFDLPKDLRAHTISAHPF